MTSKPTQPTARDRFEDLKKGYLEAKAEVWGAEFIGPYGDFLIDIVEAAVSLGQEHRSNREFWEEIDQRLAEGENK